MKLLTSLTSPYGRKVRVVMAEKRLDCDLVEDAPWEEGSRVPEYNPLGKVPVLVLDDGTTIYDSRVIVEYLDSVTPVGRLIPEPTRQRIAVRRWEALCDGVCDAAAAIVIEKRRSTRQQSAAWITRQHGKILAGLKAMAADLGERNWCTGEGYNLADVAAGCALGYLDLRFPDIDWRGEYPNLARLEAKLAKRATFQDTAPPRG